MTRSASRVLIAGTGSGCGKTTVVCAILQALKNRGHEVASFKCGPDYIDPMFHSEIIGTQSTTLDLFFSDDAQARSLFAKHAAELNVIEGVMGFYDGMSMDSERASSHHVARTLDAPAILVVNGRGMALSAAAVVKGYMTLRQPSGIAGVIFNRISPMIYPQLKAAVEKECGVKAFGYLPSCPECALESRHLGLVTAQEVADLRGRMQVLANQAEKSIDLDALVRLMQQQSPIAAEPFVQEPIGTVRIAVARDKAFCFYYRDNLEMLQELGTELVEFSPLSDEALPPCDGLILGGGYPELYAKQLSENASLRSQIRAAIEDGLPTLAECGGFMYLTGAIAQAQMCGILPTNCFDTGKLCRFGYTTVTAERDNLLLAAGDSIRAHEFHYWDAKDPGGDLVACKPSGRNWRCAYASDTLYAGYPHLYFPSAPGAAKRFVKKCLERKMRHEADGYRKKEL